MRVFQQRGTYLFERKSSGHSKMYVESVCVVEGEDDSFAAPIDFRDDSIQKMAGQIRPDRLKHVGPFQPCSTDHFANQ